jgi:hypothetical protein
VINGVKRHGNWKVNGEHAREWGVGGEGAQYARSLARSQGATKLLVGVVFNR